MPDDQACKEDGGVGAPLSRGADVYASFPGPCACGTADEGEHKGSERGD